MEAPPSAQAIHPMPTPPPQPFGASDLGDGTAAASVPRRRAVPRPALRVPRNDADDLWDDDADSGLSIVKDNGGSKHAMRRVYSFTRGERVALGGACICALLMVVAAALWVLGFVGAVVPQLDKAVREAVKRGDIEAVLKNIGNKPSSNAVNAQNDDQLTALHYASMRGKPVIATALLERRANVDSQTTSGMTPLHYASRDGHTDAAEVLLQHRADVDALDTDSWTPLHWSSLYGHVEMARFLVDHGGNPLANSTDEYHRTPLELAEANRFIPVASYLRQAEEDARARIAAEAAAVKATDAKNAKGEGLA